MLLQLSSKKGLPETAVIFRMIIFVMEVEIIRRKKKFGHLLKSFLCSAIFFVNDILVYMYKWAECNRVAN